MIFGNKFLTHDEFFLKNCTLILLIIILGLFCRFPIIGCYLLVFSTLLSSYNSSKYLVIFVVALCFSSLVTSRHELTGLDTGGFGSDIIHYRQAFSQFIQLDEFEWPTITGIARSNTGSGEPFFWLLIYLYSLILDAPNEIWFTFVFTLLVTFGGYNISRYQLGGAVILLVFCSTITFNSYFGSVLRQALSLVILYMAVSEALLGKKYTSIFLFVIAILSHFSAFVILFCTLVGIIVSSRDYSFKKILKWFSIACLLFLAIMAMLFIPENSSLFYKLTVRFQTADYHSSNWKVQFAFESIIFVMLYLFLKIKIDKAFIYSYLALILCVLILIPFSGVSDRLYRFTYIYYMLYFMYWLNGKNIYLHNYKLIVICISLVMAFSWFSLLLITRYDGFYMGLDYWSLLNVSLPELLGYSWS
jgi:hypothetical protein